MTIHAETNLLVRRVMRAATAARTAEYAIAAGREEALTADRHPDPRRGPRMPVEAAGPGEPENEGNNPPTGHTDPTGDIAASGRLAQFDTREADITKALAGVNRALDHLERQCTAAHGPTTTPEPVDTRDLCAADRCDRLKEPGSEHCVSHGIDAARAAREAADAPTCQSCGERPVESYETADGSRGYRGLVNVGGSWMPASNKPATCRRCRDRVGRAA